MSDQSYKFVESWTEDDLMTLPVEETDYYEYKSSRTPLEKLKEKIIIAASAFWNSGGGVFIGGVNNTGQVDGGFPEMIGRQKLRDWADQVLSAVEPVGPYSINTITKTNSNSTILEGNAVLVISFGESSNPPHMAPDKKYYVRAGAHSGGASHFLVEAIRSRRGLYRPILRGVFRISPHSTEVVQLVIMNLSTMVALDVRMNFSPVPIAVASVMKAPLPIIIPAITQETPFIMDISIFNDSTRSFGETPVELRLEYTDLFNRVHQDKQIIHPKQNSTPLRITVKHSSEKRAEETMEAIFHQLKRIADVIDNSSNNPTEA